MLDVPGTLRIGLWALFCLIVVVALAIDLGLKSHRERIKPVSMREAALWSLVWISLGLAFGGVIFMAYGRQRALEYVTAYLIEKSLSVDNMFVFLLIFNYFRVSAVDQPRVLKWGILGAIVMRLVLIFVGVALLQKFHWLLYIFGALLIYTAAKMVFENEADIHPDQNFALRLFRRFWPISPHREGSHFFIREGGRWAATPLFATLLVVEGSDLVFAVDSIPAVLAISRDPFIVFTSNVFAILGLRALYFLLSGIMGLFRYLRYGLALVLCFIGLKMLLSHWIHVPIGQSLLFVASVLGGSILLSIIIKEKGV